jgi:hypothetical protein
MSRFLYPVLISLLLTGCGNTRDPQAVSALQPNDNEIGCAEILTEYKSNTESADAKIKKNNSDDVQDVLVGLFIWPGLADFKNAEGTEGNALLDRNIRLKNIAIEKKCEFLASLPVQPIRYD